MKIKNIFIVFSSFVLIFSNLASSAFAADSASFNPTSYGINAQSAGSELAVGSIIVWPVASNPEDAANWLECNGQTINSAIYPELAVIMGARVPDLRGVFLRGHGSQNYTQNNGSIVGNTTTNHQSGSLEQIQGDAQRLLTGEFIHTDAYRSMVNGVFYLGRAQNMNFGGTYSGGQRGRVDSTYITPVAVENRPVNMAVRYLVRAKN